MSLKKLSLAAALSIGILTINGIANAATCPCAPAAPCAQSCAPACPSIGATLPNMNQCAQVIDRQAFAYPSIGNSSYVMPKGLGLVQIGGRQEAIAFGNLCPSGLTAVPEMNGALTLYPKNITGAAACGCEPVCPKQIMQGTNVSRCSIPNSRTFLQPGSGCAVGGASALPAELGLQLIPGAQPSSSAQPCSPCETGGAAQIAVPAQGNYLAPQSGSPIPIQTSSGLQIQKTEMVPIPQPTVTGAACPVGEQYPDVSNNMYAGCDINTLTVQGALAGYPDRYYKPNQALLRSELAAAIVAGFDLKGVPGFSQQIYKDVPSNHWAKADIDKAYNKGIITGNASGYFRPQSAATNLDTLTALGKVLPSSMVPSDVQGALQAYPDASSIPSWAKASVAAAVNAGALKGISDPSHINPNSATQRTDIAVMVRALRQKLALEPASVAPTTGAAAPCYQPQVVTSTIPTLKLKMHDIVTARTSLVGDVFVATTTEPITINGQNFPCGSEVRGRVVEVVRPTLGDNGAIRLGFNSIKSGNCTVDLPKDVLSATVVKEKNPNIISRIVEVPFTWAGKVVGIAGRTIGGGVVIIGDAAEGIFNNFGNGNSDLFGGEFRGAGRSYVSSGREAVMGVVNLAVDAFSGVVGLVKESADEVAYVVSPDGARIAQVNPKENLSIAFGACNTASTGAACPLSSPILGK